MYLGEINLRELVSDTQKGSLCQLCWIIKMNPFCVLDFDIWETLFTHTHHGTISLGRFIASFHVNLYYNG